MDRGVNLSYRIIIIFFIISTVGYSTAYAHPGNTDSGGGHVCRTNCGEWGLGYGEYHYHDSHYSLEVKSNEDYYDEGYDKWYELEYGYTSQCEYEYEWWWEGTEAFGEGYEQGIAEGHEDGVADCLQASTDKGIEYGYTDFEENYEYNNILPGSYDTEAYEEGYEVGCEERAYV